MREVNPAPGSGRQVVQSYRGGRFRISGNTFEGAVIVLPERVLTWPVADLSAVGLETLGPVIATEPGIEILLLGTGARMQPVSPGLRVALRTHGIVVDAMGTGAACRTFNVLVAEDRRVAAALIPDIVGGPWPPDNQR